MTLPRKLTIIFGVGKRRDLPNVITFLTDFGWADSYVGQLKGVICSINPEARLVDLTHSIAPGDLFGASFILKTSYRAFPKGTTHLVVVDPGVGSDRRPVIVVSPDYFFVGPDNGVFSYIYDENEVEVFEITTKEYVGEKVGYTFHGRDIFAPVAAHLSLGVGPENMGGRRESFVRISLPELRIRGGTLRGEVIHIDSFGNLITNIPRQAMKGLEDRPLIEIRGKTMEGVSRSYVEKEEGSLLAIWGSSDLLEISLSRGEADRFLGVKRGEPVMVRTQKANPKQEATL